VENLIDHVNVSPPLGKSDHVCLECDILLKVHETDSKIFRRNFWKGDYDQITKELSAVSWEEKFAGKTVEEYGPVLSWYC